MTPYTPVFNSDGALIGYEQVGAPMTSGQAVMQAAYQQVPQPPALPAFPFPAVPAFQVVTTRHGIPMTRFGY